MIKILFVCHGNICRSTMAEFVMKDLVKENKEDYMIASAATSKEEIGNDTQSGTKRMLDKHHIPYTRRATRVMTKEDYEAYDLLIGMDDANISNMVRICHGDPESKIHSLLSYTHRKGVIADPWYSGNFEQTYEDIVEGCLALKNYTQKNRM